MVGCPPGNCFGECTGTPAAPQQNAAPAPRQACGRPGRRKCPKGVARITETCTRRCPEAPMTNSTSGAENGAGSRPAGSGGGDNDVIVLMVGDVVGAAATAELARRLPALRREHAVDLVVVNAENSAPSGLGPTEQS